MDKKQAIPVINADLKDGSSIDDLLFLARAYEKNGDFYSAGILFDRASTGCYGMTEYARFLLIAPPLENLSTHECLKKAERLLVFVAGNGNESEMGHACMMLANLYRSSKEIRSLGFLMRANRYGRLEDTGLQAQLLKRIVKMEIADVESDPYGCYLAGVECAQLNHDPVMRKWAMYFLEIAVTNGNRLIAGLAAMFMADLYEEHYQDKKLSAYYRKIAARNGNPEVLTRH